MQEPVLPPDVPRPLDEELLAWAAGFFDGEGSTYARRQTARPDAFQLDVSVSQSGPAGVPEVLLTFQRAMLGVGGIYPQPKGVMFKWWAIGSATAELALALMWEWLGPVKRAQASAALDLVRGQYRGGRQRRAAKYRPILVPHNRPAVASDMPAPGLAWAAGFLDAEGCFGIPGKYVRRDGSAGLRVRVSASQHGEVGVPADVLIRLRDTLGIGRIEKHGEPDDFRWSAEGTPNVRSALERVRPWLGQVKTAQAEAVLSAQQATRVRGGQERCIRGHLYDGVRVAPDGSIRQNCSACDRFRDRAKRLAKGGVARIVKTPPNDPTRVYRVS